MTDTDASEPLTARKLAAFMPISRELYDGLMADALSTIIVGEMPTDEERAEMQRVHDEKWRETMADYQRTRELCAGQPGALAALDVHKPVDEYGGVCALEEDEYGTSWPCSTYEAIRNAV